MKAIEAPHREHAMQPFIQKPPSSDDCYPTHHDRDEIEYWFNQSYHGIAESLDAWADASGEIREGRCNNIEDVRDHF